MAETNDPSTTVAEYWAARIPHFTLVDAQGFTSDMTIGTPCGRRCRQAIDSAAGLLRHVRDAYGAFNAEAHPLARKHYDAIARATADTVLCNVYG